MPGGGDLEQNLLPPPADEQPTVPRDGIRVSLPPGMTGEVFPIVYPGGPLPAPAATVPLRQSAPHVTYPAYGEPR
jgi:hypothetical protein